MDQTVELYLEGDPEYRRPYAVARRCLDTSQIAPKAAVRAEGEATLRIKEIFDRIELPPRSQIPDATWVEREALTAWTIPHTEIELVRLEEGDQAGEFVFSAATVARTAEFFARVRDLPYRPGKRGALYEEIRFGTRSRLLGSVIARLPSWAKQEAWGQLRWQWAALVLLLALAVGLTAVVLRIGGRHTRPVSQSRGLNRLWALVGPVMLIAIALLVRQITFEDLSIWGTFGLNLRLALTVVAIAGCAWLSVVLVTRGAEHLILSGGVERPLSQQLIRVSSRALALLLVLGWTFVGGQRLGVPLTAMVAGLGVGGLAVALAAQSSIENLIGGISLFADQPVRIGDWMRLGERIGRLEEVGLRSAKIRTTAGTIVTVPNAEFAKLTLENLSSRESTLLETSLRIRCETTRGQLRYLLAKLHDVLLEHPEIEDGSGDAKLVGFGPYFLELQVRALAATTDWARFKEIRQDVFLRSMAVIEDAGTALAMRSQMEYASEEQRPDPERVREIERLVAEWRERGELPIPDFSPVESGPAATEAEPESTPPEDDQRRRA